MFDEHITQVNLVLFKQVNSEGVSWIKLCLCWSIALQQKGRKKVHLLAYSTCRERIKHIALVLMTKAVVCVGVMIDCT